VKVSSIKGNHFEWKNNQDVKAIEIGGEHDYLPSNIGAHFPKLERIYAENNNLKSIRRENFKLMGKLKKLELKRTQISEFNENTFADLISLESLRLIANKIRKLPQKLLWKLKKLKEFNASKNKIKLESVIDENLFDKNVELEGLWIFENQIKVLPKKLLSRLVKLRQFSASVNQIEVIDSDFFANNKKLQFIYLDNNKLKFIPVDFTKSERLNYLNLHGNVCINNHSGRDLTEIQRAINANCTS